MGAAAVAGEEQRAGCAVRAERLGLGAQRLAEVLVGGGRVAHMEPHGLADPHPLADGDRARTPESAPMIGRTRKSPRPYSGRFSSMTSPISTPEAASSRSRLGQGGDHLAEPLHRRLARQLADHVGLGAGDRHLGAHRAGALRDARAAPARPRANNATAPSVWTSPSRRRIAPAGVRGAREPTQNRHVRPRAARAPASSSSAGKLNGSQRAISDSLRRRRARPLPK